MIRITASPSPSPSRAARARRSVVIGASILLLAAPTLAEDLEAQLRREEAALMKQLQQAEQTESALEVEEQAQRDARAEGQRRIDDRSQLGAHQNSAPHLTETISGQRETPKLPVERELPRAIFEERQVTIEARTWNNPKKIRVLELVLDADRDGNPEVIRYLDRKTLASVRQEEDRNYDGQIDSWKDYDEEGRLVARALDNDDDGKPEIWEDYSGGFMSKSRADRDGDGVADAFYRYSKTHLTEERHDADNDGEVDLIIHYSAGRRHKAEEDRDRDHRFDTWTIYGLVEGSEMVTRIERDKQGRGYADTFEIFEIANGRSILSRREEDMNGDGKIDMISIYTSGKLVRRDILNPDVVPL